MLIIIFDVKLSKLSSRNLATIFLFFFASGSNPLITVTNLGANHRLGKQLFLMGLGF